MKHGAVWYKREPGAYLGGVQGMPMRLHAVYGVVVDLCYQYGGAVHNDPKWISGWISDMGAATVRKAIADLIEMGKLFIDGDGNLSQIRAKSEAKTRENLSASAAERGKKGGIISGKSRAAARENNDIGEATASSKTQADKIREEHIEREANASLVRLSRFSEFWDAYPHRGGVRRNRKGAEAKYRVAVRLGVSEQTIIDGARSAHSDRRVRDGFARDPTTWLNQEGWTDEIDTVTPMETRHAEPAGQSSRRVSAFLRGAQR